MLYPFCSYSVLTNIDDTGDMGRVLLAASAVALYDADDMYGTKEAPILAGRTCHVRHKREDRVGILTMVVAEGRLFWTVHLMFEGTLV